ncbi:MAG: alanine racemase [Anaerolineaceae bacterium]|nr:alanine racemase [Anaerolineaceae bacterium]
MHMISESYPTWLEIDLGAIQNNIHQIQKITNGPVMAVVKANGYGHGLLQVGRAAEAAGVPWLGVARLEEALDLRRGGVKCHILVMGYTMPERIPEVLASKVTLTVYDQVIASDYAAQARFFNQRLPVHVKVDSGMGRLGFFPEDGVESIRRLNEEEGLSIDGIFTHLACSDEPDEPSTNWQLERFQGLLEGLDTVGLKPALVHAANSAGAIYFPKARYDIVRCGIAIYGMDPSMHAPLPDGFRKALTWKSHIVSIKYLPKGRGVGYNYKYVTQDEERIGVVAGGYADGLRRRLGNFALVHGKRVNMVGGMCMDQCMVQLDQFPEAKVGDEVVFIGRQGDEEITPEALASDWGSNNYEVVSGLAGRLPRLYIR